MLEKIFEAFVGLITFGYSQRGKKDRKVFEILMEELPLNSSAITLLREHDMGDSFKYKIIMPLNHAVEDWYNIDRKFLNKKVEKRKLAFLVSLEEFLDRFSERSAGEGKGFISIGMKDWEDRPEMIEYKESLNELATNSCKLYNEFVDYARRKLPV